MAPMTTSDRQAMGAIRASVLRLRGPQAPAISSPLDRVRFIRRHLDAIEGDLRVGSMPAPTHLSAIAAHALILYGEARDDR